MSDIKANIQKLTDEMNTIVDAVNGIDTTVNESSTGVTDIAEKTSEMVNDTAGSVEKVNECKKAVATLNDIIAKFQL